MQIENGRITNDYNLIDILTAASESDGIGMYHDSEWLYIEMRDEISDFVEENF